MYNAQQANLFDIVEEPKIEQTQPEQTQPEQTKTNISEWGTFKDSLKAPVHGWFTYPAGFSFKAVEHSIKNAHLKVVYVVK